MIDLYIILLGLILSLLIAGLIYILLRYFEYSLFFLCLSPWISAIFYENTPALDAASEASLGSYLRIGLLIVLCITGIIKYIQLWPVNNGRISINFILLSIFIFIALLSTGYSIDKNFTLIRSVSFLALEGFLLGFDSWLIAKKDFDKAINILYLFIVVCILINLAALPVLHDRVWWWESEDRFLGLWDQPNTMGAFCMISYPVVLWKYSKSASLYAKLFTVFIFLILGTLHFMTGSRTSLFVTIAGLAVWFVARREILKTGLLIASSAIIIFLLLQFKPQGFQREEGKGLMDLTGREDFWEGAQTLISEKPISGYGYAVEGKVWEDARFYNVKNSLWQGSSRASLHNGYISVAIGVGLISFILWCTILIIPLWRGLFLSADNYKALFISIIMMLLLTNFVETAISGGNSIESIFFWIIWVMLSKAPKINFRNTV